MDQEKKVAPISHDNKPQYKKRRGRPPGSTIKNSFVLTSSTLFDTSRRTNGGSQHTEYDISNKSTRRTRRQRSDDYIRRKFLYEETSGSDCLQPDAAKKVKKKQSGQIDGVYQSKSRRGRPPKNGNSKEDCRIMPVDFLTQDDFDGLLRSDIFDFCLTSPLKVSSKRPLDLSDLDLLSEIGSVKIRRKSKINNDLPEMTDEIVSDYLTDCNLDELGIASDELPDFDFPDGQNGLPNVEGLERLVAAENYLYDSAESPDFLIESPNLLPSVQNPTSIASFRTVPQRRRKSPLRPFDSLDYQLPCFTSNNPESCALNSIDYPQLLPNQTDSLSGNSKSLTNPMHDLDLSVDFNQIPFQLDNNFKTSCLDSFPTTLSIIENDVLSGISCGGTSTKRLGKTNRRTRKIKEDNSFKATQPPMAAPVKANKRPVAAPHRPSILRQAVYKSAIPSGTVVRKDTTVKQSSDSFSSLTKNMTKYTSHPDKASDLIFRRLKSEPNQVQNSQSKECSSKLLQSQTASSVLMQNKQVISSTKPVEKVAETKSSDLVNKTHSRSQTKAKLMNSNPKSVKSIKIQEASDESVSGFQRVVPVNDYDDVEYDVYRIPPKGGYSSNPCFVDYEPQIKERREKVVTQDMIDQRPRQAIRKYYNSLKKHLNKQSDRQSVNVRSYWSQSNEDSKQILSNEPTTGPSEPKYSTTTTKSTVNNLPSVVDSGSRQPQKHYKVVVVDDPSGYQEAVLVSHPPFQSTLPCSNPAASKSTCPKYIHNSTLTTNTAVRSIKGRSRRSLLKEFRAGVEDQLRNAALRQASYNKSSMSSADNNCRQVEIHISDSSITEDE